MSRKPDSEAVNIYETFPEEYKQLKESFIIDEKEIKLKKPDKTIYPRYDAMYRLYSMILAKTDRMKLSDLYENDGKDNSTKEGKRTESDGDMSSIRNNDHVWLQYMFQMPGIEEILGIKRNFKVKNMKEVFQEPLMFLMIVYYKISYQPDTKYKMFASYGKIMKMVEHAFEAYNECRKNKFDSEQLKECVKFLNDSDLFEDENILFKNSEKEKLGGYLIRDVETEGYIKSQSDVCKELKEILKLAGCELKKVEDNKLTTEPLTEKIKKLVPTDKTEWDESLDYEDKIEQRLITFGNRYELEVMNDDIGIDYKKGERILFPRYMLSIFIGMNRFYKENPIIYPNKAPGLWEKDKIISICGGDKDIALKEAFYNICKYLVYKNEKREFFEKINWEEKSVNDFIEGYYRFCIGTYYYITKQKIYKEIAIDTFEKIYGFYLFNEEAKIIHKKVNDIVEKILSVDNSMEEQNKEELLLDVAEKIIEDILSDAINAIYCSPGILHRVELAKYILDKAINVDDLAEEYRSSKGKKCFRRIPIVECDYWEEKTDYKSISVMNREYEILEQQYISMEMFFGDGKIDKKQIAEKYKRFRQEATEYIEFYDNLFGKIYKEKVNREIKNVKSLAKRVVKSIFKEGEFQSLVYKKIFLGVIWYSFISEKVTWVELEIAENV